MLAWIRCINFELFFVYGDDEDCGTLLPGSQVWTTFLLGLGDDEDWNSSSYVPKCRCF